MESHRGDPGGDSLFLHDAKDVARERSWRRETRGVLFDLDGTLLDSLEDLGDSMNSVLTAHGYPAHEPSAYRSFVGEGMRNLVVRALPPNARGEDAIVESCLASMRREYSRRSTNKTRPYPGIPELLDHLAGRGIPRAMLSNKPHELAVALIAHYFGPHAFDFAFGQRPGVPLKPDPAAALEICRLSGLPANAFLYLGDSMTDMRTARAAGMRPVGVLWGFRDADELLEGGAENLISRPMDLVPLL